MIEVLRTAYGQYWLRSLNQWDSRHESLGSYCQKIQLEYSLDEGKTWNKFTPDKSIARITATLRTDEDFIQYLTEKDWREVEKVIQEHYQPSLASQILSRAQEFVDQGNLVCLYRRSVYF